MDTAGLDRFGVSMDIVVHANSIAEWNGQRFPCALGRSGVTADKREGDGATPAGDHALRRVLYRADRVARPQTVLPAAPLSPLDAWCDDPKDPGYNTLVRQPYGAGVELLWRDDHLYDIIVVLEYNDDPVVPGRGSAIFLHIAGPDFAPTRGCVAVSRENLLRILAACDSTTRLCVEAK